MDKGCHTAVMDTRIISVFRRAGCPEPERARDVNMRMEGCNKRTHATNAHPTIQTHTRRRLCLTDNAFGQHTSSHGPIEAGICQALGTDKRRNAFVRQKERQCSRESSESSFY